MAGKVSRQAVPLSFMSVLCRLQMSSFTNCSEITATFLKLQPYVATKKVPWTAKMMVLGASHSEPSVQSSYPSAFHAVEGCHYQNSREKNAWMTGGEVWIVTAFAVFSQ